MAMANIFLEKKMYRLVQFILKDGVRKNQLILPNK